jgi:hypothetical protein
MNSETTSVFIVGFVAAGILALLLMFIFFAPLSTEISREIVNDVQQSTNIVEALKKEHLIIRDINHGADCDTVEIIVEYDFLHKNSKRK